MKKLYIGKSNLVKRAHNIKVLGANTSKVFDQELLEHASDDQVTKHRHIPNP